MWILIAAAWLFVFLKLIIGALFEKNTSLVAAFSVTNPEAISATVEVAARYPAEDALDKKKMFRLMEKVADGKATKIIIPSEMQGLVGMANGLVEGVKE